MQKRNLSALPLHAWYLKALENSDIHHCTDMSLLNLDVDRLFEDDNALEFIRGYLGLKKGAISKPLKKIENCLHYITSFRARHTVAAFLLGISVKEELTLDIRNWIRLYSAKSSDESFGFFWSLICLLHDVGYHWERNSNKYTKKYGSIDDFCRDNDVSFNLIDVSKKSSIINGYFKYRLQEDKKIDHGVAGALLIYDALLSLYNESKISKESIFCGMHIRENFPDFALKIAETIALHNMWRATEKNRLLYEKYGLTELTPDASDSHKVYYGDDKVLFLLGLIDTMDPIKAFCNTERSETNVLPSIVLNEFQVRYINTGNSKQLDLNIGMLPGAKYEKSMKGMADWLGVLVVCGSNPNICVTFLHRRLAKELIA